LASSVILDLRVYDTQCGAKAFRTSRALQSALAEPFHARWAFDVELIGRLLTRGLDRRHFIEMPLRRWTDVPDSKLTIWGAPQMFVELCRVWAALRADRREQALLPAAVPRLDEGL